MRVQWRSIATKKSIKRNWSGDTTPLKNLLINT